MAAQIIEVEGDFSLGPTSKAEAAAPPAAAPPANPVAASAASAARATARDMARAMARGPRPERRRAPTVTEAMSSEERAKWQTLVMTLRRYSASKTFGPLLASYNFDLSMTAMKQMTVPQLEDVLDRARICCQNSTMTGMFGEAAISCVGLVEQGVTRSPLGKRLLLQGLTESVRNDSSFMTALEQCSIDYGCSWACRPEYRLLMSFVAAAGRTHAVNAFLKVRGEAVEGEDPGGDPEVSSSSVAQLTPWARNGECG